MNRSLQPVGAGVMLQFIISHVSSIADLTLYEVHRKPHDLITDESLIAVSPRALHAELMCPICLDLMRNTQTTKEVGVAHDTPITMSLLPLPLPYSVSTGSVKSASSQH